MLRVVEKNHLLSGKGNRKKSFNNILATDKYPGHVQNFSLYSPMTKQGEPKAVMALGLQEVLATPTPVSSV